MEEWYRMVRNLKDDSEDSYLTQQFIYQVFRDLKRKNIKEKVKFKSRMGPEFEQWTSTLEQEFSRDLIVEILNDDEFWELTLKVTIG
jgi:hypothetical protein